MATRRGELRETAPTLSLVSGVCAAKLWVSLVINGVRLLPVRLLPVRLLPVRSDSLAVQLSRK